MTLCGIDEAGRYLPLKKGAGWGTLLVSKMTSMGARHGTLRD